MKPRHFTVTHTKDQLLVGAERTVDLERVARKVGRSHAWSAELNAAEKDNRETDLTLSGEFTTHYHSDDPEAWNPDQALYEDWKLGGSR